MEQTRFGSALAALLIPVAMSGCGGSAAGRPAAQLPGQSAAALTQYPSTVKASTPLERPPAPHGRREKLDYGGSLPVQDMNVLWDVLVPAHDHMSTISSS